MVSPRAPGREAGWDMAQIIAALVGWSLLAGGVAAAQPLATPSAESDPPPPQAGRAETPAAPATGLLRFEFGPKFLTGVPVGTFGDRVGASPGAGVDLMSRLGQTPFFVGVAFDYLLYGTETRRVPLLPSVPEVLSDVDTRNNLIRTHAIVRVRPSGGRVRPYAEGLLGFSYVYTRTSIDLGYESGAGTTHLGDFAPSLGAGGGVTIELLSGPRGRLGLDIGLRYLTSGEVDYLARGDLQRDGTGVTFEPSRSPASLFGLQVGIAVDF